MENIPKDRETPQSRKKKPKRRGPRLTGLSKQRRLANARERNRVHTLNSNIRILRKLIPLPPQHKEPSKTEIIWLAASYIGRLMLLLKEEEEEPKEREPVLRWVKPAFPVCMLHKWWSEQNVLGLTNLSLHCLESWQLITFGLFCD